MFDAIKFKLEAKDNPLLKWADIGTEAWKEMGRTGPSPEERAERAKMADLENQLKTAQPVVEHYHNKGIAGEKTQLLGLLDASFGKERSGLYRNELRQFETRAWANTIDNNEVAETYKQIARILSASGDKPLAPELRKRVASQVIRNCADPTIITQGGHNTCNVTAVEVRTYSLYPARAAKLVADIATTGEHTTKSGIRVKLDDHSMAPDNEALKDAPEQGQRTYATQLFNLAAVNIWYGAMKPGTKYEQRETIVNGKPELAERLVDYSHGKPVYEKHPFTDAILDSPYLCDDQIAFISDAIVGKHEPFALLKMGTSLRVLEGEKSWETHATDIINEHELSVILDGLKKKHLLPAIAGVDTNVEPLNQDSGSGAYGPGGGHVVNLTDYSGGKVPKVAMDNEWSRKNDHIDPARAVDVHDIYLCMAGPEAAREDAALRAEQAKKEGRCDIVAELAKISNDHYKSSGWQLEAEKVISNLKNAEKQLTGQERDRWFAQVRAITNEVNPKAKVWFLQRLVSNNICSNEEFGKLLAGAVKSVSFHKQSAIATDDAKLKNACVQATTALAEFLITLPPEMKTHYFKAMRQG